jgi:hypothetical protein
MGGNPSLTAKAKALTRSIRDACTQVERQCGEIEMAAAELTGLGIQAQPDPDQVAADFGQLLAAAARTWLDRQRLLGRIGLEGVSAIELLIEDLR